ncbi:pyrophosphorylase [Microtetraspora sp. NBRC 13810]|uniref:bifunctional cytidylyltransferase/SDR family oxidoreductase n=1 Tax=Microtetraspora sp. NBRC 13810 TaxID=3030990 RepID=UPI0024A3DBEB|nr:bifunctional cytidylyltransferase/SDR family oxidoreductase [Microtetraspora sp. NBRC 13810]GLW05393.1 pyrophosphorylase [Microtetraspora sp. NBRC 13810]
MAAPEPRLPTVGVILAGGVGQRLGHDLPKQLLEISGRTILERAVDAFERAPEIDDIIVLMTPGFTGEVEELVARNGFAKVRMVLEGGASRTETTWRALSAIGARECDVLLHDAARPLVEPRIITECVEALRDHRAVNVAVPSSDTVLVAQAGPHGEVIGDVPERAALRRSQTPQCFRLSVIREAYERALADPAFGDRPATDDCGVVRRYLPEVPIHLVPGSELNIKITHPADLAVAETLLRLSPETTRFMDYREALAGRTVVVFGGYGAAAELAELAAEHGARVYTHSRAHGTVHVADATAVTDALDQAAKETGRIDYVVSAAEVRHMGPLAEAEEATVAEVVGVNLLGSVHVARAALGHLRETGGHLLFQTGSPPAGPHALYAATVAALGELTRELAREWAGEGVRVNCVRAEQGAAAALGVLASGFTGRVAGPH